MTGYVDLHCHYLAGVDDGARTQAEGEAILRALSELGFERAIATPHMRPGMFDNSAAGLRLAFEQAQEGFQSAHGLPELGLGAEHYFDDVVFGRILGGQGLPYPGGRAVLLEFYEIDFPYTVDHRLAELRQHGLLPVIAHPERYRALWRAPEILERLVDVGAAALLDAAALVGKYGKQPQRTAELLLERGLYHAACSDAHRPEDALQVKAAMARVLADYGSEELTFLFNEGPRALLEGRLPT